VIAVVVEVVEGHKKYFKYTDIIISYINTNDQR